LFEYLFLEQPANFHK